MTDVQWDQDTSVCPAQLYSIQSVSLMDYISATVKRDKALRLTEKIEHQGGGAANKSKSD